MMHLHFTLPWILAQAVAVFAVLQAAKKAGLDGYISGRLGVAFNVAFAFLSTIVLTGKLDAPTLCQAIAVSLAAAGLHAHAKTIGTGSLTTLSPQTKTMAMLALVLLLPLIGSGCANRASATAPNQAWDVQTYAQLDDLRAAYEAAFSDAVRAHQTGVIANAAWPAIERAANTVHDALQAGAQALNTYEQAKYDITAPDLGAQTKAISDAMANIQATYQALTQAITAARANAAHTTIRLPFGPEQWPVPPHPEERPVRNRRNDAAPERRSLRLLAVSA